MTMQEPVEGRAETVHPMTGIGIIVNPKHAPTHRSYAVLTAGLRRLRMRYRTMTTTESRSGRWQAEQLLAWGAETIILLGGDGTIRAAAPVLAEAGVLTFLIPTGTANVLSRHVGISSAREAIDHCLHTLPLTADPKPGHRPSNQAGKHADTMTVVSAAATNHGRSIPINTVEARGADGSWTRHDFISLAGIGGDARAVAHHHRAPGLLGYAWGAARALFAADLASQTRRAVEASAPESMWSMMASKVARPAGPISVFPDARIDDAEFSVLRVGPLPRGTARRFLAWGGIASACLQGRPAQSPFMHYRRSASATVKLTRPAPAQVDGDLIGDCLELRVSAGESRLWVSAPPS
ncbi:hypothetical protein EB836_05635 [Brevibacterium sp. S111]|nr:hypothetical protein EB836_05635 [Brevibacterium sp. S111]